MTSNVVLAVERQMSRSSARGTSRPSPDGSAPTHEGARSTGSGRQRPNATSDWTGIPENAEAGERNGIGRGMAHSIRARATPAVHG
jgi:hypothetical protein